MSFLNFLIFCFCFNRNTSRASVPYLPPVLPQYLLPSITIYSFPDLPLLPPHPIFVHFRISSHSKATESSQPFFLFLFFRNTFAHPSILFASISAYPLTSQSSSSSSFSPFLFLLTLFFSPVRPVVIERLSDGGVSHPFVNVFEPTISVIVNLSFPAPEISLNEDNCPLSVDLLSNSFDGIVKNAVGLVLEVVLPPLLQKHMENRRVVHSVVTKSFEVVAGLHLTVAPVAEVVLLDNACGKEFDVANDVAKFLQSPLSLCRLSSAFTTAIIKILKQLFKIVLVILP